MLTLKTLFFQILVTQLIFCVDLENPYPSEFGDTVNCLCFMLKSTTYYYLKAHVTEENKGGGGGGGGSG